MTDPTVADDLAPEQQIMAALISRSSDLDLDQAVAFARVPPRVRPQAPPCGNRRRQVTDPSVNEIEVARKQLAAIAKQITDIKRRDSEQVGPDGYRTGTGNGRMSKGTHSDPTALAADSKKVHDKVHEHTTKLLAYVKTACGAANRAAGYLAALEAHVDERTGRPNLVECCPVCDDPMPQPRAGLDDKCFRRWVRAGRPERAPWINQERRRLADMREAS